MSKSLKKIIYSALFIVVLVMGLLFFTGNNQPVIFNYIFGSTEWPISILLLGSLFIGILMGMLALVPVLLKLKHKNSKLQKQITLNEKEIDNLRTLPAKFPH